MRHLAGDVGEEHIAGLADLCGGVAGELVGLAARDLEVRAGDGALGGNLGDLGDGGKLDYAGGDGFAEGGERARLHAVVEAVHADGEDIVGLVKLHGVAGRLLFLGERVGIGAFEDFEALGVEHAVVNLRIERFEHTAEREADALLGHAGFH